MTLSRPAAKDLLEGAGLRAKRALGQNFVVDPNTVRRIARLSGAGPGVRVVEVGAGLGSLTIALAETGAEIIAIEVDADLVPILEANVAGLANVRVVHADAMTLSWEGLLGAGEANWMLVANLPYNVATPLVADILDGVPQVSKMLVMVQREVAERFVARPSTPAYGAVSVKTAWWADARIVGQVPASVFLPRPNVESSLVEIVRHPVPDSSIDTEALFSLVRQGFAKRRKMLRGSLAGRVEDAQFAAADVAPTARAEELDVAAWVRLARATGAAR